MPQRVPQEEVEEPDLKRLTVFTWLLLVGVTVTICVATAIDTVELGPQFTLWVYLSTIAGTVLATALTFPIYKHIIRNPKWNRPIKPSDKTVALWALAAIITSVAAIGISVLVREYNERMNEVNAQEARRYFMTLSYLGGGPEFDEHAVNQTLSELHESHSTLMGIWEGRPNPDKIQVDLFRDAKHYRQSTGLNHSSGHILCFNNKAIISIPLEKPPSASESDIYSTTPKHEVVHALMCQSMGSEAYHSTPRWFHEGIAERYQNAGLTQGAVVTRILNRARVWWKRKCIPSPEEFCRLNQRNDDEKITLFYATALEFIRHLESKHDMQTINQIPKDVAKGAKFKENLLKRLGGHCQDLYGQWRDSFTG